MKISRILQILIAKLKECALVLLRDDRTSADHNCAYCLGLKINNGNKK